MQQSLRLAPAQPADHTPQNSADFPDKQALCALFRQQLARYNGGGSSSVSAGTAQALMECIRFCVDLYQQTCPDDRIDCTLETMFQGGVAQARAMIKRGKLLLYQAKATAPKLFNRGYRDTMEGIGGFFSAYRPELFGQECPCYIDYPLCIPLPDTLQGISFINRYLSNINRENAFINTFDPCEVRALLSAYCGDYEELLMNIYTSVAESALGRVMMGLSHSHLGMDPPLVQALAQRLRSLSPDALCRLLSDSAETLCREKGIDSETHRHMLRYVAHHLQPRIQASLSAGGLGGIFFSLMP